MNTWRPYQLGNQVCLSGILFSWKLLNWMVLLEFGWFCFWISLSFFLFFFNGFLGFLAVEVLDMEIMEFYGCDAEMMIWCLRLWFIFWGGKGYIIINAWWPSISFDIVCFVLCVCVCVCVCMSIGMCCVAFAILMVDWLVKTFGIRIDYSEYILDGACMRCSCLSPHLNILVGACNSL